ncbi:MAG: molybdenum cofactor guanylyltransferase [Acidobacteriota bacterium]|nr:molybdenum cofactor guanylyltransferase [Acidobacteriota bacterium]
MHLQGALLIGGRSTRMGRPKSRIPLGDTTWGRYLSELLRKVTGNDPVLVGEGSIDDEDHTFTRIADKEAGAGPLSALLGLYRAFPDHDFLVLATDLPNLNTGALRWLIEQAQQTEKAVVWPRFPNRELGEPLAAYYRTAAHDLLQAGWDKGERGLIKALHPDVRFEPVIPDEYLACFDNFNKPEDLARLWDGKATPESGTEH